MFLDQDEVTVNDSTSETVSETCDDIAAAPETDLDSDTDSETDLVTAFSIQKSKHVQDRFPSRFLILNRMDLVLKILNWNLN